MEQEQDNIEQDEESAPPDTPLLRVKNLSKTYSIPDGRLQVLQEVDLQVQRGEFIAITGPSGSGKTTLLSLLGALDSPDSGEIWLEDRAVNLLRQISDATRSGLYSNSFTCCRTSPP